MSYLRRSAFLSSSLVFASIMLAQMPAHPRGLQSRWTAEAIRAGSFDQNKIWGQIKPALKLNQGWVYAVNDATSLFLLVDLVADTGDDSDPSGNTANDAIDIVFDIDRDGQITPGTDSSYFARAGSGQVMRAMFQEKRRKPSLTKTGASAIAKFGPSRTSSVPHRQWEIAIPLTELSTTPGSEVRLGIRTWSTNPQFDDINPPGQADDFTRLAAIGVASASAPPVATAPVAETPPPSATAGVIRTINSDGKVEIRRPDGSRRIMNNCGWIDIFPDGRRGGVTCAEAPGPSAPPIPTNPQNLNWLIGENDSLLAIMKSLVGNDSDAVQHYLDREPANWTVYDRIKNRTVVIEQLLRPQ